MTIDIINMTKGWLIDVVTTEDCYEFWIYRKEIGIKSMMFGLMKENHTKEKAIEIAKVNYPDYTDDYMYDYC